MRNRRRSRSHLLVVPTMVSVEARWGRRAAPAATANRLPIADRALDTAAADRAAHLVGIFGVSPADAHIGAVIGSAPGAVTVLTSDVDDVAQIVCAVGVGARIVRI